MSTNNKGESYASLVAFWDRDDLKKLYFVTPKTTRKYSNLKVNPNIAMLINNSINADTDFHDAISITATGQAQETIGIEKKEVIHQYLKRHPFLEDFANSSACALICINVKTY